MSSQQETVGHVTPVGGNVFADLGFQAGEAANLKVRSELMMRLSRFVEEEGLTQENAAALMETDQPRISDLMRGKIDRFTIDALVNMLSAAGLRVHVHVEKAA
jgi:predicted XRE-type DNA-binding protein